MAAAQAATLAVFAAHAVVFASWTAHIPLVKARLGLSDGALGLALFGVPIGSILVMPATAALLVRFGSRRMVQCCLLGYGVVCWTVGLAGSGPALFAALAAWGVFLGALDVSMNAQAVIVERAAGRPIMSGLHGAWSLGSLVGAGLGALAVAGHADLTLQLALLAGVSLVVVLPAARLLLPDPAHPADELSLVGGERRDGGEPDGVGELGGVGETTVAGPAQTVFRRHPVVIGMGAIALACSLCEGAAADWSAVYLHDVLGATPGVAGLGYAAYNAATVLQRFTGDRLLTRFGARTLLPVLAAIATLGMSLALLTGTVAAALVGFATLGTGVALIIPVLFTAAGRLAGVHPGTAVAAVSALGWSGFVAGPPLLGHLAQMVTLPVALGLLPVLTAGIALSVRATRVVEP